MQAKLEKFPKKIGSQHGKSGPSGGDCPKCGEAVPPKAGFRFSSLKCPKCGASMGKQ